MGDPTITSTTRSPSTQPEEQQPEEYQRPVEFAPFPSVKDGLEAARSPLLPTLMGQDGGYSRGELDALRRRPLEPKLGFYTQSRLQEMLDEIDSGIIVHHHAIPSDYFYDIFVESDRWTFNNNKSQWEDSNSVTGYNRETNLPITERYNNWDPVTDNVKIWIENGTKIKWEWAIPKKSGDVQFETVELVSSANQEGTVTGLDSTGAPTSVTKVFVGNAAFQALLTYLQSQPGGRSGRKLDFKSYFATTLSGYLKTLSSIQQNTDNSLTINLRDELLSFNGNGIVRQSSDAIVAAIVFGKFRQATHIDISNMTATYANPNDLYQGAQLLWDRPNPNKPEYTDASYQSISYYMNGWQSWSNPHDDFITTSQWAWSNFDILADVQIRPYDYTETSIDYTNHDNELEHIDVFQGSSEDEYQRYTDELSRLQSMHIRPDNFRWYAFVFDPETRQPELIELTGESTLSPQTGEAMGSPFQNYNQLTRFNLNVSIPNFSAGGGTRSTTKRYEPMLPSVFQAYMTQLGSSFDQDDMEIFTNPDFFFLSKTMDGQYLPIVRAPRFFASWTTSAYGAANLDESAAATLDAEGAAASRGELTQNHAAMTFDEAMLISDFFNGIFRDGKQYLFIDSRFPAETVINPITGENELARIYRIALPPSKTDDLIREIDRQLTDPSLGEHAFPKDYYTVENENFWFSRPYDLSLSASWFYDPYDPNAAWQDPTGMDGGLVTIGNFQIPRKRAAFLAVMLRAYLGERSEFALKQMEMAAIQSKLQENLSDRLTNKSMWLQAALAVITTLLGTGAYYFMFKRLQKTDDDEAIASIHQEMREAQRSGKKWRPNFLKHLVPPGETPSPYQATEEREAKIQMIMESIRTGQPVLILGESSQGKSALLEEIQRRLKLEPDEARELGVPEELIGKTIYRLDPDLMEANTKYVGTFAEKVARLKIWLEYNPDAILFADEWHRFIGLGEYGEAKGSGVNDFPNKIKEELARKQIRFIAATTTAEYQIHFKESRYDASGALERRFRMISLDTYTKDEVKAMLRTLAPQLLEKFSVIRLSEDAIDELVEHFAAQLGTDQRNLLLVKCIEFIQKMGESVLQDYTSFDTNSPAGRYLNDHPEIQRLLSEREQLNSQLQALERQLKAIKDDTDYSWYQFSARTKRWWQSKSVKIKEEEIKAKKAEIDLLDDRLTELAGDPALIEIYKLRIETLEQSQRSLEALLHADSATIDSAIISSYSKITDSLIEDRQANYKNLTQSQRDLLSEMQIELTTLFKTNLFTRREITFSRSIDNDGKMAVLLRIRRRIAQVIDNKENPSSEEQDLREIHTLLKAAQDYQSERGQAVYTEIRARMLQLFDSTENDSLKTQLTEALESSGSVPNIESALGILDGELTSIRLSLAAETDSFYQSFQEMFGGALEAVRGYRTASQLESDLETEYDDLMALRSSLGSVARIVIRTGSAEQLRNDHQDLNNDHLRRLFASHLIPALRPHMATGYDPIQTLERLLGSDFAEQMVQLQSLLSEEGQDVEAGMLIDSWWRKASERTREINHERRIARVQTGEESISDSEREEYQGQLKSVSKTLEKLQHQLEILERAKEDFDETGTYLGVTIDTEDNISGDPFSTASSLSAYIDRLETSGSDSVNAAEAAASQRLSETNDELTQQIIQHFARFAAEFAPTDDHMLAYRLLGFEDNITGDLNTRKIGTYLNNILRMREGLESRRDAQQRLQRTLAIISQPFNRNDNGRITPAPIKTLAQWAEELRPQLMQQGILMPQGYKQVYDVLHRVIERKTDSITANIALDGLQQETLVLINLQVLSTENGESKFLDEFVRRLKDNFPEISHSLSNNERQSQTIDYVIRTFSEVFSEKRELLESSNLLSSIISPEVRLKMDLVTESHDRLKTMLTDSGIDSNLIDNFDQDLLILSHVLSHPDHQQGFIDLLNEKISPRSEDTEAIPQESALRESIIQILSDPNNLRFLSKADLLQNLQDTEIRRHFHLPPINSQLKNDLTEDFLNVLESNLQEILHDSEAVESFITQAKSEISNYWNIDENLPEQDRKRLFEDKTRSLSQLITEFKEKITQLESLRTSSESFSDSTISIVRAELVDDFLFKLEELEIQLDNHAIISIALPATVTKSSLKTTLEAGVETALQTVQEAFDRQRDQKHSETTDQRLRNLFTSLNIPLETLQDERRSYYQSKPAGNSYDELNGLITYFETKISEGNIPIEQLNTNLKQELSKIGIVPRRSKTSTKITTAQNIRLFFSELSAIPTDFLQNELDIFMEQANEQGLSQFLQALRDNPTLRTENQDQLNVKAAIRGSLIAMFANENNFENPDFELNQEQNQNRSSIIRTLSEGFATDTQQVTSSQTTSTSLLTSEQARQFFSNPIWSDILTDFETRESRSAEESNSGQITNLAARSALSDIKRQYESSTDFGKLRRALDVYRLNLVDPNVGIQINPAQEDIFEFKLTQLHCEIFRKLKDSPDISEIDLKAFIEKNIETIVTSHPTLLTSSLTTSDALSDAMTEYSPAKKLADWLAQDSMNTFNTGDFNVHIRRGRAK